ncbi:MAG: SpoIIE family protein phosphatase [Solirubrobacteraceae bacterium]
MLKASPEAVIIMGADGLVREWNPAAEIAFGYSRAEAVGSELSELIIPEPLRDAHRYAMARYLETGEETVLGKRLELSGLRRDGSEFPVELTITVLREFDPPLFFAFVRAAGDGDALPRRENARLQQRMAFLAQTSLVLDRSLDYNETLRTLADLTVPSLAQLTVIDLLDDDGTVHTAVAAAADPARARDVESMREAHPLALDGSHPVAAVLRSAQPVLLPAMTPNFLRGIAAGNEHFALMRRLRYHSAIVVPLIARRRALGTLSLLRMEGTPSYNQDDLVLVEELARRAAMAIDNARLFEATRHIARTLQASLLPQALPEIPGVRVAGRYRAAAADQEVGGDFYDAFTIGADRWGIVIGDVCGKGPEAAALTALARYTIRALSDHSPAKVLTRLNDAVLREGDSASNRFLTGIFAVAQARDGKLHLELAAGGHPPPVLLRRDGSVEQVDVGGPLIGVIEAPDYTSASCLLHPGDTMVLYTDGLTDARAPAQILSGADVLALLARGHRMPADRLAEFLEHEATGGEAPRDDIALLVVQLADME